MNAFVMEKISLSLKADISSTIIIASPVFCGCWQQLMPADYPPHRGDKKVNIKRLMKVSTIAKQSKTNKKVTDGGHFFPLLFFPHLMVSVYPYCTQQAIC